MSDRPYYWYTVTLILIAALGVGLTACNRDRLGKPLPGQAFQFPTGIAVHPDGFVLVASSNDDLTYQSGSLRVIDLNSLASSLNQNGYSVIPDENGQIPNDYIDLIHDDWGAVSLDNFAGRMAISSDGTLAAVTIRETNQLVLVDLTVDTSGQLPVLNLSCSDTPADKNKKFPFCSGDRYVVELGKNSPQYNADLQFDPFDVVLLDQQTTQDNNYKWWAYVSFLRSGTLSIAKIPDRETTSSPVDKSLGPATGDMGINDLVYSPSNNTIYMSSLGPKTTSITENYVTSLGSETTTITDNIFYFAPPAGESTTIPLYNVLLGTETVGLEVNQDGSELAAVVLNPNMLLFLDTNNSYAYLGSVALGPNPSLVRRYNNPYNNLFFVTFPLEDLIYIIDGDTKRLIQVKDVHDVCNGPFDMGFFDRDSDNIHWALFTCFENDTVAVMDL